MRSILLDKPSFTFGIATDKGNARRRNDDAAVALTLTGVWDAGTQDVGLFVVADGIGGEADAAHAAQIAIQTLTTEVVRRVYEPLVNTMSDVDVSISRLLTAAFESANRKVRETELSEGAGGTTLTAGLIVGRTLYLAHVGDSAAYLITPKSVLQLTEFHHLAHRLVELGEATWEEINAGTVQVTNVLYRAVGKRDELDVDVALHDLPPGSHVLFCTDGLTGWNWERISESEAIAIILTASTPQEACARLVALAKERDSLDNITAVLVQMDAS